MSITKEELEKAHKRYDEALLLKSKQLPDLDRWYRSELRRDIQSRKESKDGSYVTSAELVKLMKWKLTRGKFRPRLENLVKSNSEDFVKETTSKAFTLLEEDSSAKEAMATLNVLKGVGPATSSAIMAIYSPEKLPFMSDEGLEIAAGLKGKPKYSPSEWKWYSEQMQERVKWEKWKRGVAELEEAAWAYATFRQHGSLIAQIYEKHTKVEDVRPAKRSRVGK